MNLILLILFLGVLLIVEYFMFHKDITAPALLFSFGFFLCSINLMMFVKIWNVSIHATTLWLIILSNISLLFGSFISDRNFNIKATRSRFKSFNLNISVIRLKFLFILQIVNYCIVIKLLFSFYGMDSLAANLVAHTEELKFGDNVMILPPGISFLNTLVSTFGYFIAFLLSISMQVRNGCKKQRIWLCINFIIWLLGSLLSSGRSSLLHLILSFFILLFMIKRMNNKKNNFRLIAKYALIAMIFLASFQQLGQIIGRKDSDSPVTQVIGIYLGAEIQNLDDFILSHNNISNFNNKWGVATFEPLYFEFQNFFGKLKYDHNSSLLIFNERKGYQLGNVATALQSYYYDFGFCGTLILCFIIGIIMQYIYKKAFASVKEWHLGLMTFPIFLFVLLSSTMFMSFFSECFVGRLLSLINWRMWLAFVCTFYLLYGKFPWSMTHNSIKYEKNFNNRNPDL